MSFRVVFFGGIIYVVLFVFAEAVKSRPVGGESCHIAKQGDCNCQCVQTSTSTLASLAYLYKRIFVRPFSPVEVEIECNKCKSECARHMNAYCKNGKCGSKGCKCFSCWKGRSCDQPAHNTPPQFEQNSYAANIPANIEVGMVVLTVGAFDGERKTCSGDVPCPCANILFSISSGNDQGYFSIGEHSGKIMISKSLRAHDDSSFDLIVSAANEGEGFDQQKGFTTIHISVTAVRERRRRSAEHHVVRRSTPSVPSAILVVKPEVLNNTFYKPGNNITFNLTLSHNQSASSFAPVTNLVVKCNSTFLSVSTHLSSKPSASVGSMTVSNEEIQFNVASFPQNAEISVTFQTTVKSNIHPLANLYMICEAVSTPYKIGPVSSSPSLYAVFPKVTLNRITDPSKSLFDIDDVLHYRMTVDMPHLDFPLFVEVTSAINDFSFMPIYDVQITETGSNINAGPYGTLNPATQYTKSSSDLTFYDSATLDFKNLTVTAESDVNNKIKIEWKVNLTDYPLLANGSKQWNGGGLSSGPNMLHVAQQAIYVKKIEPTLSVLIAPQNDTSAARFSIDDQLFFTFECNHTNTSTADAQNVVLKCFSTYLGFVSASYTPPGGSESAATEMNVTMLNDIKVSSMPLGSKITGKFAMKVRENMNPLVELDVFCRLAYQNIAGKDKMTTTHKAVPQAVAAVPVIKLNIINPLSCYKIGSEIELEFKVLIRKMNTPLLVEFIAPVNGSAPIMAITSVALPVVGSNIQNHVALSTRKAVCKSTVNDSFHDRCTIDFGITKSTNGITNNPANEISIKFKVLLIDHPYISNGSKYWPAVGVKGGSRMMWIGETAVNVCMSADPKPILKLDSKCYILNSSQSCCEGNLRRNDRVQFNITVSHDRTSSEQHADNVKIVHMIPPYVKFLQEITKSPSGMTSRETEGGPELKVAKELRFTNELSYSYVAEIDPLNKMPTGDVQATSVAEVSYYGHDTSIVLSRKAGVCCYYKNPAISSGKPVPEASPLPEYYKRGFLLIPESKSLFVCSDNTARTNCFYTNDAGITWVAMNEQVGCIIGNKGETLYAISNNKLAYMMQESRGQNWYAIARDDWEKVKSFANATLKTVADDHLNQGDPSIVLTDINKNGYGGNKDGIYFRSGEAGTWVQKAMWKCCN